MASSLTCIKRKADQSTNDAKYRPARPKKTRQYFYFQGFKSESSTLAKTFTDLIMAKRMVDSNDKTETEAILGKRSWLQRFVGALFSDETEEDRGDSAGEPQISQGNVEETPEKPTGAKFYGLFQFILFDSNIYQLS